LLLGLLAKKTNGKGPLPAIGQDGLSSYAQCWGNEEVFIYYPSINL